MRRLLQVGVLALACAPKLVPPSEDELRQVMMQVEELRKNPPCRITEGDAPPDVQLGCRMTCAMQDAFTALRSRKAVALAGGRIEPPRVMRMSVQINDAGTRQVVLTRLDDGGIRCDAP